MYSYNAEKCFSENLRLFGNAKTEPEKYNLYNGLRNLASAIKQLEQKVEDIENKLNHFS